MSVKVSVIVPIYNTSKYLRECLDSLERQTLEDIEVILIDDGSTDESPNVYSRYIGNPKFNVFRTENRGPSESRNEGVRIAVGRYCMFVDSDDWLEIDACEKLYLAAKETGADLVIGAHVNEASSGGTDRFIFQSDRFFSGEEYRKEILNRTLGIAGESAKDPGKLDLLTPVWSRLYRLSVIRDYGIEYIDLQKLPSECLQFNFDYCSNATSAAYIHDIVYHYRRNTTESVTKNYRDDLWRKWDWWIRHMEGRLEKTGSDGDLLDAFYGRICCSVIPLGGNAVKLPSLKAAYKECKGFLDRPVYKRAFSHFDYSACPVYWRLFFYSAREQNAALFLAMTKAMRCLLKRRKA